MDVFFQFVSAFALFFGIAGLVYATEVSKRCQLIIEERMNECETILAEKSQKQDQAIKGAIDAIARTAKSLEETELAQTREINVIRKTIEPLMEAYEKAKEEEEKARKRQPRVAVNIR
ncbi:MAG: hypothetical protein JJ900_14190 [Rhodospirillales bacterium]|nr:hypothetical protein [Rhodospirillales bacterium]MBO6787993.1 hypothetical protein [Rhodospirillales bacterium]